MFRDGRSNLSAVECRAKPADQGCVGDAVDQQGDDVRPSQTQAVTNSSVS